MTVFDFLDFAKEMDVDGVSLESCFFPSYEDAFFADLKARLDEYGFDRVYAWGHPDGLEAGRNEDAFLDMIKSIEYAAKIGVSEQEALAKGMEVKAVEFVQSGAEVYKKS